MKKKTYIKIDLEMYEKIEKLISEDTSHKKISNKMYQELVQDMKEARVKRITSDYIVIINSVNIATIITNLIFTYQGLSLSNILLPVSLFLLFLTTLMGVTPYRNSKDAKDNPKDLLKIRIIFLTLFFMTIAIYYFFNHNFLIMTIILLAVYITLEVYLFMLKGIYKKLNAQDDFV